MIAEQWGRAVKEAAHEFAVPTITDEVMDRYRQNYFIPPNVTVTKQMIEHHVELERGLTQRLLSAEPADRAAVWAESYDALYRGLPWLAQNSSAGDASVDLQFGHYLQLIPPGSSVIEIGSGAGSLARYLTQNDRPCVATEITDQRGGSREGDSVEWHSTDGVHLDDYEDGRKYDAVLSMQVIEHLHPDDVQRHFEGAFALVKPGGRYILTTPHIFLGPADLSRVFSLDRAQFMHLKEYTHRELGSMARQAGFRRLEAVYVPPSALRTKLPFILRGRWFYRYLSTLERALGQLRLPRPVVRALLFHCDVFLVASN